MPNFENEASLIELELKKKQSNELEQFRDSIEAEAKTKKIHYSGETLNQLKKIEFLSNQGCYKEARDLKKKIKDIKKHEKLKFN